MADFVDWGGGDAFGDDVDADETDAFKNRYMDKDAVLFLIDCRSSMFQKRLATAVAAEDDLSNKPTVGGSAFARAVRSALQFYQDKVVTSERDLSGLLLFGCKHHLNPFDFPNIYIFHDMDLPSASRVQELEVLSKAGEFTPDGVVSETFKDFEQFIGHFTPGVDARGNEKPLVMSEVLWAAQHMFRHLPTKNITYRRMFLFTDDDDPVRGAAVERDKSIARMKDLADGGVTLEVFVDSSLRGAAGHRPSGTGPSGFGTGTGTGSGSSSLHRAHHSASASGGHPSSMPAGVPSASPDRRSGSPAGRGGTPSGGQIVSGSSGTSGAPTSGLPVFDTAKFWDQLLQPSRRPNSLGGRSADYDDNRDDACGAVHVSSGAADAADQFDALLSEIRMRTFPQRSNGTLAMQIGTGAGSPKVTVGVFLPIMKVKKPTFTWLEGSTNAIITSETRTIRPDTGAEVLPEEILLEGKVGGSMVKFTPQEVSNMKSQFGQPGISIIAFKSQDTLKAKYNISRSAFLHPTIDDPNERKLFVQLHRSLRAQKKVGIASMIPRAGAPPRLVALLPSDDAHSVPDAVQGTGFHLIYLPYADDVRSLKFETHPKPSEAAVNKAKRVIRKLSVDYEPAAIANPARQQQYHHLQQLALMEPTKDKPVDYSLPDYEGMSKYADAYRDVMTEVYPPGYNPDSAIPSTKTKPPPSKEELDAIDFEGLEAANKLNTLTVNILKEFLKQQGESTSGLKAELVDRAGHYIRRKKAKKRPRDDGDGADG